MARPGIPMTLEVYQPAQKTPKFQRALESPGGLLKTPRYLLRPTCPHVTLVLLAWGPLLDNPLLSVRGRLPCPPLQSAGKAADSDVLNTSHVMQPRLNSHGPVYLGQQRGV